MDSHQRVLDACAFRTPDRIPTFDTFWEFPEAWRGQLGDPVELSDIAIWYPDETPFPSHAGVLAEEDGYLYERDPWGRTVRRRPGACFVETLSVAIPEGTLVRGSPGEIEAEAREIIDLGRHGGVIIGTHSISPEIPLENYRVYRRTCLTYGRYR